MRPALLLCCLALFLVACATEPNDSATEFTGAERAVAAAVEELETAARDDDSEAACARLFSAALLASLEARGDDCESAVKDAFQDADSTDLAVDDVTISGEKATARVTSGTGDETKTSTLELEKAGAGWRIATL